MKEGWGPVFGNDSVSHWLIKHKAQPRVGYLMRLVAEEQKELEGLKGLMGWLLLGQGSLKSHIGAEETD